MDNDIQDTKVFGGNTEGSKFPLNFYDTTEEFPYGATKIQKRKQKTEGVEYSKWFSRIVIKSHFLGMFLEWKTVSMALNSCLQMLRLRVLSHLPNSNPSSHQLLYAVISCSNDPGISPERKCEK